MSIITPVVLASGVGARLWPVSRESLAQQFTRPVGEESLFQQALLRINGGVFSEPLIITSEKYRFLVAQQL